MTAYRKPGMHNRSTGPIAGKRMRRVLSPTDTAGYWIVLPLDLLSSPAWLAMSTQCRRFVEALMVEFCAHAGMENGNLKATYDQLETRGLQRKSVLKVVIEAEALGIVQASRGQRSYGSKRAPSTYRLTWYGTPDGLAATHEWKAIKAAEEAEIRVRNAVDALVQERGVKRANRERRAAQRAARMGAINGAPGTANDNHESGAA